MTSHSDPLPADEKGYRIVTLTGAAPSARVEVGQTVWMVADEFSLAHDDSRHTGIEYVAVSPDLSRDWYFTIPLANLSKIA